MKKCPNCHEQYPDDVAYCAKCGSPVLPFNPTQPAFFGQPPVQPTINPGGEYVPPQPIKPKNNTLLIIICAVASVIICGLLLFIFIGKSETKKEASKEEVPEKIEEAHNSANKYEWLSERLVTAADLEGKTAGDLRLMRNAIFARHGYKFKSADLKEYFSGFDWYVPKYADVQDRLSAIETKNIAFIKKYEGSSSSDKSSTVVGSLSNVGFTDDYSDIVCYRKLTHSDLSGLSKSQLRILRNTIYARHGRKFKSADLRNYFNRFSWYNGLYDEISTSSLSDIEKHNITLIQQYE